MSSHLEVLREMRGAWVHNRPANALHGQAIAALDAAIAALSAAPGCSAPSPQQPAEPPLSMSMFATRADFEAAVAAKPAEPQQDGGAVRLSLDGFFAVARVLTTYGEKLGPGAHAELANMVNTTPQPAARRVTEGVFVEPVIVPGSPHAHIVRFRVGQQRFDIGDALDTQEEAAAFAGMFKRALESFANGGA